MSIKDYEGGIITKNPTTPTGPYQNGAASGVWTMDQAAEYTKQGVWPIAGNVPPYVDDVFSTYLYDGNGSSVTVNNGIDLSGEGGMVWVKNRTSTPAHAIYDTERGPSTGTSSTTNKTLASNSSDAEGISGNVAGITSFNSNGFTTASDQISPYNVTGPSTQDYVSWTFRKQAGFFDVVTYTGTGSATTISHNLGSVPGVMIIKRVSDTESWQVYHRDFATDEYIQLNGTAASTTVNGTLRWNNTRPTDTVFSIGTHNSVNGSGDTYVAYLFAHDDQRFGDNGDESIIKCGTYGPGTETLDGPEVTLGWEPQWVLVKAYDNTGNWSLFDNMRGVVTNGDDKYLRPNGSNAELTAESIIFTPTGFKITSIFSEVNQSGINYIYIAIRRPMKTPTAGTEVFSPVAYSGNSTAGRSITSGFPLDAVFTKGRNAAIEPILYSRLQGSAKKLFTYSTAAEASSSTNVITSFDQDGMTVGTDADINNSAYTYVNYFFKRAPGFMDVVCYAGNSTAGRTVTHNLGVTPEFIIVKGRDGGLTNWVCYHSGNTAAPETDYLYLNEPDATSDYDAVWNDTAPTSTVFTLGHWSEVNNSGQNYMAYLFATLAGISKVGSYTGTAANLDVDCGFTAGARFILIKRTDSTGDWYVYDSARGIVSGNDPYLLINSSAAEVTGTDYIDPLSSGFTVTSSAPAALNASGGNYIFLAIA